MQNLLPNSKILNNMDWLKNLSFLDALSDIARYISVSSLIKLETFAKRLMQHDPLNLEELLYPMVQGYDFLWLFENENCAFQCGGSDQWANIITGADLIKRKHANKKAIGITWDLLTLPDGSKMGKSVNGAVWIDPNLYSPNNFWQYFRNLPDASVKSTLLRLTLISVEEINNLISYDINEAKKVLATDVTTWVHGSHEAMQAENNAKNIFIEKDLSLIEYTKISSNRLFEVLVELKIAESNSIAKSLIEQKAVKINGSLQTDKLANVSHGDIIVVGKKHHFKVSTDS